MSTDFHLIMYRLNRVRPFSPPDILDTII